MLYAGAPVADAWALIWERRSVCFFLFDRTISPRRKQYAVKKSVCRNFRGYQLVVMNCSALTIFCRVGFVIGNNAGLDLSNFLATPTDFVTKKVPVGSGRFLTLCTKLMVER